jgi:S1-C subfamily serine protease
MSDEQSDPSALSANENLHPQQSTTDALDVFGDSHSVLESSRVAASNRTLPVESTPAIIMPGLSAAPESSASPSIEQRGPSSASLLLSTVLSLSVVLVLLIALRLVLPSMLELSRYSWYRGQLRAEYEVAGQQLERVSLDGISSVSQTVARRVCPSVVHITIEAKNPNNDVTYEDLVRPDRPKRSMTGQGSGVIVDARGYILTNYHVISDENGRAKPQNQINVTISDERQCRAELIGVDSATDLAVIKIKADDLLPITWGDSECLEVGAPVWAVGSPFGLTGSITFGILSSKHRLDLSGTKYDERRSRQRFTDEPQYNPYLSPRYSDLMQSDVAVNPGNSGGPLVNGRGELIGINTAIIGTTYQGVSFAIPSKIAKDIFEQILETGKITRGWLGVELVKVSDWQQQQAELLRASDGEDGEPVDDVKIVEGMPTRGAVVRRIVSGDSPAAIAGLSVGDLITAINDQQVRGVDDLILAIGNTPVGSTIQLTVDRKGKVDRFSVVVGERPEAP